MFSVTIRQTGLDFKHEYRFRGLNERFDELGLHEGSPFGIANGPYTETHKRLRKTWHQTWLKLMSRSEMDDLISNCGKQLIENIVRA